MRRDPATILWATVLALAVALILGGVGVLVLNDSIEHPSDTWRLVGMALVALGVLVAFVAAGGFIHLGLESAGRTVRIHWPIVMRSPVTLDRDRVTPMRNPDAARSGSPIVVPKRPAQKAQTQLKQRGELKLSGNLSLYTPEMLLCIDAILADSPIAKRTWYINDKLGDHQSDSLSALLDDVIWDTVTWIHVLTGVIPGGIYAPGQPAALSLSFGLVEAEIWWTDPALGPAIQRVAHRIKQCVAGDGA